jgi:hypothetical protein
LAKSGSDFIREPGGDLKQYDPPTEEAVKVILKAMKQTYGKVATFSMKFNVILAKFKHFEIRVR